MFVKLNKIETNGIKCKGFDMKFPNYKDKRNVLATLVKFNATLARTGETPSSNFHATARGLGKFASCMAKGGTINGKTLLSPEAFEALHAKPTAEHEPIWNNRNLFTQGGLQYFNTSMLENQKPLNYFESKFYANREGFYGWFGIGGSVMQWHPELKIGFAYLPCEMSL